jgi:carbonic anhydrase
MSHSFEGPDAFGPDRASFLRIAGLGFGAACVGGPLAASAAGAGPPSHASSPAEALQLLVEGDARFTAGAPVNCGTQTARMVKLSEGQNPFVIILGCSDSRVPNDTIFDQQPGSIFSVRVAGNYVTSDGLGSIEYGVAALKSMLIVVLGHQGCGAVKAAIGFVKDGTTQPGHIADVVAAITPAAMATKGMPGDWLTNAIEENVKLSVQSLTARSAILRDAKASGAINIVGGVYNIETSKVAFLE